jgi:redox-sensing transcriptional repressor
MTELPSTVKTLEINIGIVSVPVEEAQKVINLLVINKITGILNYAPISPKVPKTVIIINIDPIVSLQSMTYYMKD